MHGPVASQTEKGVLMFAHLSRQDGGECPEAGSAALLCPVLMEQQTIYTAALVQ